MGPSKTFLFFILGLVFLTDLHASKRPVIYVASLSGLSFRAEPKVSSDRIMLLPYGTKITNYHTTEFDTVIDGYQGSWLRVALNGKDGYIFSGYTLPVIPPTAATKSISHFLVENLGEPISRDSFMRNEGDILKTTLYKKSVMYQESEDYITEYSIINLNLTVQEAYLLFYLLGEHIKNLLFFEKNILPAAYPSIKYKSEYFSVTAREYDHFEYGNGCLTFKIVRLHSGVVITWWACP